CKIHNMLKEEPGWTTEPTRNGGMTITTPTGRTYTAAPEPLHDPRPEPEDDTPPF
ncbi:HNH endonuclease, partial [Amycolatopsis japonica]